MPDGNRAVIRLDKHRRVETDRARHFKRSPGERFKPGCIEIERVGRRWGDTLGRDKGRADQGRGEGRCEATSGGGRSGGTSPDADRGQRHHRRGSLRQKPQPCQGRRKHDATRHGRRGPRRGPHRQEQSKSFHLFPLEDQRGDRDRQHNDWGDPIGPEARMPRVESPRLSPPPEEGHHGVSNQDRQPEKPPEPDCQAEDPRGSWGL